MKKTLDRATVSTHFAMQAGRLPGFQQVKLAPRGSAFSALYQGRQASGIVLVRSSDFWEYRLHLSKKGKVDILVCYRHDTVVALPVWELETGKAYEAYEFPHAFTSYEDAYKSRSKAGRLTIVGGLLCGVQRAYDLIEADGFPESTRRKYETSAHAYQKRKRGRQLAIMPVGAPVASQVQ